MKRTTAVVLAAMAAAACSDAPTAPIETIIARSGATIVDGDVIVTNSSDAGAGSFRDAITMANGNAAIATIAFRPDVNTINLQSGIVFTGTQDLTINAKHAMLDGSGAGTGATAFLATGGGDLELIGLTVKNAGGQGVEVRIPLGATGTIRVQLDNVDIVGNAGHGFMVDDQAYNTAASVDVYVNDSRFLANGFSESDRDGIRVNEGGDGDIAFTSWNSRSDGNAADGIELDERDNGNVTIDVWRTRITRNGVFDPLDLDDGFDIDEWGTGSILGQVVSSSANHNFEEGLDFNENDAGDLRVDLTDVEASFNREEGIDYEEDDDNADLGTVGAGHLVTVMTRVTAHGNGGDGGVKIREKEAGNLDVLLTDVSAAQNIVAGIHVREGQGGTAAVRIEKAVTNGNGGDGVEVRGSTTTSTYVDITTSGNGDLGLSVESGTANITSVKGSGNANGLTGGGATFVIVP